MAVRREVGALILVGDGDELHRASVTLLLRQGGYETHEVEAGHEALAEAHRSRPALVVLDVRLRDVSGYEVCRQLREAFGETLPIMFVSALRTEPYDRVGGLLLGADDYLAEPFAPDELLARVRRLVARSKDDSSALNLTKRELEILRLLASGRNQSQISAALVIAERTVATHIQHILAKLGVHSRAQAVAVAHRRGLGADDRRTPT
jgi:DNA-binding NarL/FixJ family response regulator